MARHPTLKTVHQARSHWLDPCIPWHRTGTVGLQLNNNYLYPIRDLFLKKSYAIFFVYPEMRKSQKNERQNWNCAIITITILYIIRWTYHTDNCNQRVVLLWNGVDKKGMFLYFELFPSTWNIPPDIVPGLTSYVYFALLIRITDSHLVLPRTHVTCLSNQKLIIYWVS